ncbi:hypothetical protein KNP414_06955 [Paenibacillus mucilaginosus KNP414]|uniref:Uncharacterized protein n=1 Tax=Paenibacillus mucilaginosus (strain KNP414) TaxID=1036673 RepID=F8FIL3_PAEMK|nr:hypothetical protein KNP414_06955 [Paenibacillus mucilaginosus KNP414]
MADGVPGRLLVLFPGGIGIKWRRWTWGTGVREKEEEME